MKKILKSKRNITLLSFIVLSIVCLIYLGTNSNLFATNKKIIKQDKGMTVAEFQKKISQKDKLVLVYFNASWCVPCIKLKPVIAELETETKAYCEVLQLNIDDNPKIAEYYEINSLPMFLFYKNGKMLWENIGILSKSQLQSKIELYRK